MRCPDGSSAVKMAEYVEAIRKERDSVGGVVSSIIKNVPVGLG